MEETNTKQVLLTPDGLAALQEELDELITVKRKECSEKIKVALSFGDLSENSEYDEAKNEQAEIEARITEINNMLKYVKVIDASEIGTDKVSVGSTVTILDKEFDEEITYTIVGSTEADPKESKISDESPVGKALLGHSVGDTVVADVPAGKLEFEILKIAKKRRRSTKKA